MYIYVGILFICTRFVIQPVQISVVFQWYGVMKEIDLIDEPIGTLNNFKIPIVLLITIKYFR